MEVVVPALDAKRLQVLDGAPPWRDRSRGTCVPPTLMLPRAEREFNRSPDGEVRLCEFGG